MPGKPKRSRSASTSGVITPRFSATIGSVPSARSTASKNAAPGPFTQRPSHGRGLGGRDLPVRLEAAEVIDAHEVDEGRAPRGSARSTSGSRSSRITAQR